MAVAAADGSDNPNPRMGILSGCDSAGLFTRGTWNAQIAGAVKTGLAGVGRFLEEAAESDMGLGMDMGAGGVGGGFGDLEELAMEREEARIAREREEADEQRRAEEEAAAARQAEVDEWRVRAQVARDEVVAEREAFEAAAPDGTGTAESPRGGARKGKAAAAGEAYARLTVAQGVAALRFSLQFSSEMPDAAVVEKALYELGISVPHDASRRAKASVSCAALRIRTGWPPVSKNDEFYIKKRNVVFKTRDFVLKTRDFAGRCRAGAHTGNVLCARWRGEFYRGGFR